jgi:hypothetical protein
VYSSKYQANTNDIFLSKASLVFICDVGTEFKNGFFKEATKLADIKILMINEENYRVTVVSDTTTSHEVRVQMSYAQKLTAGKITTLELIKKSFEFLLIRESNKSILHKFDLSVISHYFPEYEREIMS